MEGEGGVSNKNFSVISEPGRKNRAYSSRLTFFSGYEDSHVVAGGYKEMSSILADQ